MSTLVTPEDAVATVYRKLDQKWAEAVCTSLGVGTQVVFSVGRVARGDLTLGLPQIRT
jgi:hypothetical protein